MKNWSIFEEGGDISLLNKWKKVEIFILIVQQCIVVMWKVSHLYKALDVNESWP